MIIRGGFYVVAHLTGPRYALLSISDKASISSENPIKDERAINPTTTIAAVQSRTRTALIR